jgi:hypothetical protein
MWCDNVSENLGASVFTLKMEAPRSLHLQRYVFFTKYYYLLTPWCRILFEKLIVTELVKNIPPSYGTQRFITVFTKA